VAAIKKMLKKLNDKNKMIVLTIKESLVAELRSNRVIELITEPFWYALLSRLGGY
jgi:hypothetical protein